MTEIHDIGWAVKRLKEGKKIARTGWNGRDMFLWLKPSALIEEAWCHDPMLKSICKMNGGYVKGTGSVCMYTAQRTVVTGWLASQTDLLAEDWVEVEVMGVSE